MSTIREILEHKSRECLTIKSDTSVFDAISAMSEANIGAIVIQDGDQPGGIFTERDYLRKVVLQGRSSRDTPVSEVMSSPLFTVDVSDAPRVAMESMTERRCRHLIVTENDAMVGIVSLGDLVKHLLHEKEAEVEQLSSYIKGNY
jgi:CBS domain-containing protein